VCGRTQNTDTAPVSHLLLPQALATTTTLAAPPSSPLQGATPSPLGSMSRWCKSPIGFLVQGRRREERGRIQGDFVIISCLFVLQSNWLYVYLCESVEVLSRNFVGERTAVVLSVSRDFSWVISGNQYENHVELCHTFPTSTYLLDSELYFRRYRCLNTRLGCCPKTDCRVYLVDCFGLIRFWNLIIIWIQNLWGILCRCFWSFCLLPLL
jgi:hypothetical protein